MTKLPEWLGNHPILANADKDFLAKVVSIRKNAFQKAADETSQNDEKLAAGKWVGKYPFLRVLHAIIDNEDIKGSFLRRAELPSGRMAIENRAHIVSVWTKIAEAWNDPAFEPSTEALPDERTDFLYSEIITHDLVAHMTPATAEKVELKWNEVKNELTWIIGNWERSGQGEGGLIAERSDGMFNDREQHALNTRRDFFTNHNTYLFYFWIQLEKHQLLASTLQKLGDNVAAKDGTRGGLPGLFEDSSEDDDLTSSTTTSKEMHSNKIADLKKSIDNHGKSIEAAARIEAQEREETANKDRQAKIHSEARSAILQLGAEERELTIKKAVALQQNNQVLVSIYESQIMTVTAQIDYHQTILASAHEENNTPQKDNTTPKRARFVH